MSAPLAERQITVTLSAEVAEKLDIYAATHNIGYATAVEDMIVMGLEPFGLVPKFVFKEYAEAPESTQIKQRVFLSHIEHGRSHEQACSLTSIAAATPYNWARQYHQFWSQWQDAKAIKARSRRISLARQMRGQAELIEKPETDVTGYN